MDIEPILTAIRNAVAPDATSEARATGATACRAILAALESTAGQPMATATINPTAVASAVAMMRNVAPDQLLDLAIAKLRAALPAGTSVPSVSPLKFHIVPVPPRQS
jgi:hypothetical protein